MTSCKAVEKWPTRRLLLTTVLKTILPSFWTNLLHVILKQYGTIKDAFFSSFSCVVSLGHYLLKTGPIDKDRVSPIIKDQSKVVQCNISKCIHFVCFSGNENEVFVACSAFRHGNLRSHG